MVLVLLTIEKMAVLCYNAGNMKTKAPKLVKITKLSALVGVLLVVVVFGGISADNYLRRLHNNLNEANRIIDHHKALIEANEKPILAEDVVKEVNILREKVGVKPIKIDEMLNISAKMKADDMATNHYYGHDNPKTGKVGPTYVLDIDVEDKCYNAGENIAASNTMGKTETVEELVAGWRDSEPHYKAMINPENDLIGYAQTVDFKTNRVLYVQHFCKLRK